MTQRGEMKMKVKNKEFKLFASTKHLIAFVALVFIVSVTMVWVAEDHPYLLGFFIIFFYFWYLPGLGTDYNPQKKYNKIQRFFLYSFSGISHKNRKKKA